MDNKAIGRYFSNQDLIKWVTAFFILSILMSLVSIWSEGQQVSLLSNAISGRRMTASQIASNDQRQQIVAIIRLLILIPTLVLFLVWINRSYKNLQSFGLQSLSFTPGWAVGWFFVPFINLVRPFQIVTEIYRGSQSVQTGAFWKDSPSSPRIGWWWGLYLTSNILSYISTRMVSNTKSMSIMASAGYISIISDLVGIAGDILIIMIVKEITDKQLMKHTTDDSENVL